MRLELSDRTLDLDRGMVTRIGDETALSPIETRLLRHLALNLGRAVPQDELLEAVWGYADSVQTRTVTVTVNRLRGKLEVDAAEPTHLLTERGSGYALHAEPHRDARLHPVRPLGPCIGRDAAIDAVLKGLTTGRVAQVLGGPGMGKTRVAHAIAERWPGPVGWFDLEPSGTVEEALGSVAQRLGVLRGRDGGAQLGRALASRVDLVVLDGAEHLAVALAPVCAEWLRATGLRLLVTSRVPLALEGSARLDLPPLPEADATAMVERLGGIDGEEALDVARRCEGVPLALELESATTRSLGGPVGRGLAGSFARSWALLDGASREALARCASFGGWFGVEDATALLGDDTLPRLHVLQTHGLLQRRSQRLRLLASLQPAVVDHAPEAVGAARMAHLAHYRRVAREALAGIFSPDTHAALDRLLDARPELEAAMRTGIARDAEAACEILEAYDIALQLRVGEHCIGWAERIAAVAPDSLLGATARGVEARLKHDIPAMEAVLAESIAGGYTELTARMLAALALRALVGGRPDDTARWSQQGLGVPCSPRAKARFWLGLAKAATSRGVAPPEVGRLLGEARRVLADDVDPILAIELEMSDGRLAIETGDLLAARDRFAAALEAARPFGPLHVLSPTGSLALVHHLLGEDDAALAGFESLVTLATACGHALQIEIGHIRRAEVAVEMGREDAEAVLDALRAWLPDQVPPDRDTVVRTTGLLRALDVGTQAEVDAALARLVACPDPKGGVHDAYRAIVGWARGEPVPAGLPERVAACGQAELAWNLAALQVLDGDADAERNLRRTLPAQGYALPRAALAWARASRAGGPASFEPAWTTVLCRLARRRLRAVTS